MGDCQEWMRPGLSSARKRTPITITNHRKTSIYGAAQERVRWEHEVQEYRIPETRDRVLAGTRLQVETDRGG